MKNGELSKGEKEYIRDRFKEELSEYLDKFLNQDNPEFDMDTYNGLLYDIMEEIKLRSSDDIEDEDEEYIQSEIDMYLTSVLRTTEEIVNFAIPNFKKKKN